MFLSSGILCDLDLDWLHSMTLLGEEEVRWVCPAE